MDINEFRNQHPEYNSRSDDELAKAIHAKYYPDKDYNDFATRFGVQQTGTPIADKIRKVGTPWAPSMPEPTGIVKQAGQAIKETIAAPVRTIESMTGNLLGGLIRMAGDRGQITPRVAETVAQLNRLRGKGPGDAVNVEHLIRKYGLNKSYSFYDIKMKKLADSGKKIQDFWNEQASKGWEAPNPEIVEARWRDRPVGKTVSAVSSGVTSIGVVLGVTFLTKSPQAGLAVLAASETGSMYGRLRDKNTPIGTSSKLALMAGAWTYATEKIPFDRLLKPSTRTVIGALKQSGWEGAQEVIEQVGHNLLEYFGYDYKKPSDIPTAVKAAYDHVMDGWVDALVGGIGAGGLAHVALHPGAGPKVKDKIASMPSQTQAQEEALAGAAIRLKSGETLTGTTHANIIREAIAQGRNLDPEFDGPQGSGFITNTGRFVKVLDMKDGKVVKVNEAWDIAEKAGQLRLTGNNAMAQEFIDSKHLIAEGVDFFGASPTVEQITGKKIEEIEPQTADHAIGHQYGLTNEEVDDRLGQAELRYRELKLKDVETRTPQEMEELAFLSRKENRTGIFPLLERYTKPGVAPKPKMTRRNLLALGHKIKRNAGLTDTEYRDFAEIVTGKRSMGGMDKTQQKDFVSALEESFGAVGRLTEEDYDIPVQLADRATSMRKIYGEALKATTDLDPKRDIPDIVKIGSGKRGPLQTLKNFFFGIDNTPVYHLARRLDGGKEGIFSEVLDKNIENGRSITKSHVRSVTEALINRLQESGVTDDDLARISRSANPRLQTYQMINKGAATETFMENINGRDYEMTTANLLDIYLISNQEAGMKHLTKGGLVIEGVETGKLSEEQIDGIRQKVEGDPKAKAIADAILEVGELIWKPSINQVSSRLEGKDIATVQDWWGFEVFMPKKLAGKTRIKKLSKRDVNLLEDKSILKDRTKSSAPLVVRDAINRFSVFENAIAEYVGMAEAARTSRTLLNDPDIATALDQKGYSPIRDRILNIHEQAQGTPAKEGNFSAFFARHLPAMYRAVLYFNPRLVVSQYTSVFNYGAYVSPEFISSVKDGLSIENSQDTLKLSDIAWDRFHMGHTSLEMGETVQSDAALRMWTGGKSSDINKAAWAIKVADLGALAAGMEIAKKEYDAARSGKLDGLSAEWWLDKDNLPEANTELWKKVEEEGENADPEERQAVEQWKQLVTKRAEYLWQRSQPSWDKWNRSTITSQQGLRRLFLLFRSFHEKSLTIVNEAKLDYDNSPKTFDDKTKFAQRTGAVLTGYTVNMFLRLAIMAAVTRELKEPVKYFEEFLTSWTGMFPIFGRVLRSSVNRFVDAVAGEPSSYTGEPIESYPVRVINMVLKSPTDLSAATAYLISGENDKAKDAFEKGVGRLAEGVGILSGIPVPEIKRVLPKEEKETTGTIRRGPTRAPTTRR